MEREYLSILFEIMLKGVKKEDRTGTGTISLFGKEIRHDMRDGFPLLTTKKMAFKTMVTELLWFLQGRTDLRYLLENDCHIWTGDAYKVYDKDFDAEHPPFSAPYPLRLTHQEFEQKIMEDDEFNKMYGDLGPIYGKQWRKWQGWMDMKNAGPNAKGSLWYDQIGILIHQLKTNPDSRRLMVNAWNVGELDQMVLPPCHYSFQVYTTEMTEDERRLRWCDSLGKDISFANRIYEEELDKFNFPRRKISLMWNQRSADYFLGVPFNIASYGLLLTILGKMVNMLPDQLIGRFGDTHLYSNHLDAARKQIPREPYELPRVMITKDVDFWRQDIDAILNGLTKDDFHLVEYNHHPAIKAPLSN